MIYGTVEYWLLSTRLHDGTTRDDQLHSWESASDAFREAVEAKPLAATVYAVQRRGRGAIKTWDYQEPAR